MLANIRKRLIVIEKKQDEQQANIFQLALAGRLTIPATEPKTIVPRVRSPRRKKVLIEEKK